MPKTGTGWLFDQLESHPDFWMPPVKELLYLNQEVPRLQFLEDRSWRALERARNNTKKKVSERVLRREVSAPRDIEFINYARSIRGLPRDIGRYAQLFRCKGELLSGDITPPYWSLDEATISSVATELPGAKILLLVRDPVARAWSRISVLYRNNNFDPNMLEDRSRFESLLRKSKKIGGLLATEVAQNWLRHLEAKNFKVVFFDDIAEVPQNTRADVLRFLGADPDKPGKPLPPDYNRKADYKKLDLTDGAKAALSEHFRDEIVASAELFGGRAREWPARYGLS
jgi:hypothetical protein